MGNPSRANPEDSETEVPHQRDERGHPASEFYGPKPNTLEFQEELNTSEIASFKRIVPKIVRQRPYNRVIFLLMKWNGDKDEPAWSQKFKAVSSTTSFAQNQITHDIHVSHGSGLEKGPFSDVLAYISVIRAAHQLENILFVIYSHLPLYYGLVFY